MVQGKKGTRTKQGPPLQFRPGVELERLVTDFAAPQRLEPNEACKVLVALAVTGLDGRYYPLMRQLAEAMGGDTNAFTHACVHVKTAVDGAALALGKPLHAEPERSRFILKVVVEFLSGKGMVAQTEGLWFLPAEEQRVEETAERTTRGTARRRRTINPRVADQVREMLDEGQQTTAQGQEDNRGEQGSSEPERQRHRIGS